MRFKFTADKKPDHDVEILIDFKGRAHIGRYIDKYASLFPIHICDPTEDHADMVIDHDHYDDEIWYLKEGFYRNDPHQNEYDGLEVIYWEKVNQGLIDSWEYVNQDLNERADDE